MKDYELVIVFTPTLTDDQLIAEATKVRELLESNGAQEVEVENWGKRELGYLIKKQGWGIYTCFFFQADSPTLVDEVQRVLRIADPILRYQTQRVVTRSRKFRGRVGKLASGEAAA